MDLREIELEPEEIPISLQKVSISDSTEVIATIFVLLFLILSVLGIICFGYFCISGIKNIFQRLYRMGEKIYVKPIYLNSKNDIDVQEIKIGDLLIDSNVVGQV